MQKATDIADISVQWFFSQDGANFLDYARIGFMNTALSRLHFSSVLLTLWSTEEYYQRSVRTLILHHQVNLVIDFALQSI